MPTRAKRCLLRRIAIVRRWSAEITPEDPGEVILVLKPQTVADFLDRSFRLPQHPGGILHFVVSEGTGGRAARNLLTAFRQGANADAKFRGNIGSGQVFGQMVFKQAPQTFAECLGRRLLEEEG